MYLKKLTNICLLSWLTTTLLTNVSVNISVSAQTTTAIHSASKESYRAGDAQWEAAYQGRLNDLLYAQGKLLPSSGNNYLDEGKNTWSLLLAELYKNRKYSNHPVFSIFEEFVHRTETVINSYKANRNIGKLFRKILNLTTKFCTSCEIAINTGSH
jgi:hypothetical protein